MTRPCVGGVERGTLVTNSRTLTVRYVVPEVTKLLGTPSGVGNEVVPAADATLSGQTARYSN